MKLWSWVMCAEDDLTNTVKSLESRGWEMFNVQMAGDTMLPPKFFVLIIRKGYTAQ